MAGLLHGGSAIIIMATLLENLITRKKAIGVELAAMASTTAGGLPDHSGRGSVGHVAYRMSLYQELEQISSAIDGAAGGWEVVSEATT